MFTRNAGKMWRNITGELTPGLAAASIVNDKSGKRVKWDSQDII